MLFSRFRVAQVAKMTLEKNSALARANPSLGDLGVVAAVSALLWTVPSSDAEGRRTQMKMRFEWANSRPAEPLLEVNAAAALVRAGKARARSP
jgi:hypothetical protein